MDNNIESVVIKIVEYLLEQPLGTEISLVDAYDAVYEKDGYQWVQLDGKGLVSSNDSGQSYLLEHMDLFDVLNSVSERMKQEGIILDFSKWEDSIDGLPFYLAFVIRKC